MEAILLVGGKGTRLHPLTLTTPKPMLKVAGVPIIAHQIGYAKAHGITRIIVASSYKSEQFLSFLGDGSAFGVEVVYAIEQEPLGTGGAIAHAGTHLQSSEDQPIAVLNGDVLSAHDITAQLHLHRENQADLTLHLVKVADARAYGSVPFDPSGRIIDFIEKSETPPTNFINAGCYIFTRRIIDQIPRGRVISVEREVFPALLAAGRRMWSYSSDSYWLDIGTPAALLKGSTDLATGVFRSPAVASATQMSEIDGALVDASASISATARISAGTVIGAAVIEDSVTIEASMIGDGAHIGSGAQVSHSIVGDGVSIGPRAQVVGAVLAGAGIELAANSRHLGELA